MKRPSSKVGRLVVVFVSWIQASTPFVLIICLAFFTRFYNASNRFSLGVESVRDFSVGLYGAQAFQLPLTGPFSSLGSFTFGPWYWYLLIFARLILRTTYSPWIVMTFLSVLQVAIMYRIGLELKDKGLAVTLGLLSIFPVHLIESATALSNPSAVNFFSSGVILLFLKALGKNSKWSWSFLMGLFVGIGFFSHYQMLVYLLFPIALFLWKRLDPKFLLVSGLGLFVTWIPMLAFDLTNHWFMVRNIWFSYTDMGNRIYVPNSWKIYLFEFWPRTWAEFWGMSYYLGLVFLLAAILICIYLALTGKFTKKMWLLGFIFFVMLVHLRFYKGERFLGYIQYTFPLMILFVGVALESLKRFKGGKYLYWIFIIGLVVVLLSRTKTVLAGDKVVIEFNKMGRLLHQMYPEEKFQVLRCETQDMEGDILSTLFILEKQDLYSDKGKLLAVGDNSCLFQIKNKYSEIDLSKYGLARVETGKLYLLESTSSAYLNKAGYSFYTFENLYKKYVLWWLNSDGN